MAAGPPGSVNALLDGEAQHSACGARFGLPASPYRSLNHGSFGQPCERAREVAAAFRAEMDTQPDLWFRERYSAHLKNATAQLEAYLHIPLSCRRLVAGEDNPEYTAGGLVFADNTTFLINSLLAHFDFREGDAVMHSTLSYSMTQKACHRHAARPGGPAILSVDFAPLLGLRSWEHGDWHLGPGFAGKLAAAYRRELQEAKRSGLRLRLAVIEHIVSAPSCVLPIVEVAAEIKAAFPEAWVCVDGAHALGSVPVDLSAPEMAGVDVYIGNGHKWLYTCRGCALMFCRHSGVLPAVTSSATLLEGYPDARCEVAWSGDRRLWGMHENFTYLGTRDNAPILSVIGAMAFRRHSDSLFLLYQRALAVFAAVYLASVWRTAIAGGVDRLAGMANVVLPHVGSQQAADHLKGRMLVEHRRYIQPCCFNGNVWLVRVSCPVYITKADIFQLADHVLDLTDSKPVSAADVSAARAAAEAAVEAECGAEYARCFPAEAVPVAADVAAAPPGA